MLPVLELMLDFDNVLDDLRSGKMGEYSNPMWVINLSWRLGRRQEGCLYFFRIGIDIIADGIVPHPWVKETQKCNISRWSKIK
jgi:hypothetical protein